MPQLHMHAVSQDLRGSCMKTRRHWNAFATDFFRDASEALRELRAKGELEWDEEEAESRVKMERLRCHACGDGPHPTMPKLFEHLDACVAAHRARRSARRWRDVPVEEETSVRWMCENPRGVRGVRDVKGGVDERDDTDTTRTPIPFGTGDGPY